MRALAMWLKMGNRKVIIIHDNTGWHVTTLLIDVNWTEEIVGMSNLETSFHKAAERALGARIDKEWKFPWHCLFLMWLSPIYFMAGLYEFLIPYNVGYKSTMVFAAYQPYLGWGGLALGIGCLILTTRSINQLWKRLF